MNLKEQQYVITLAECGSISEASKLLYITQPALSIYISKLENTLGVKLFSRIKNRYILTYAGELYVEKAKEMMELCAVFNREVELIRNGQSGRIRIGVQTRRSPYIITNIMTVFSREFPEIQVVFEEGDGKSLERLLNDNHLDVIIYSCDTRRDFMAYINIQTDRLLVAVPRNREIKSLGIWMDGLDYPQLDIKALHKETFILQKKGQSIRSAAEIVFRDNKFTPQRIMEIRNIETTMQLISKGFGVGFIRETYISHVKYVPNLMFLEIKGNQNHGELVIGYLNSVQHSENMKKMLSTIKEILSEV